MSDKKPKPINVDEIDLERMKLKTTDMPGLIEYAHSIGGFSVVPTEQGAIKGKAMQAMGEQTQMQLDMIFEQMKVLAKQAKELKDRAEVSQEIYDADMSFQPVIGEHYFLYRKDESKSVLSLVSPDEWGKKMPFKEFVAEVKLLADHTWKVIKEKEEN
jgi:hypothetical protein